MKFLHSSSSQKNKHYPKDTSRVNSHLPSMTELESEKIKGNTLDIADSIRNDQKGINRKRERSFSPSLKY